MQPLVRQTARRGLVVTIAAFALAGTACRSSEVVTITVPDNAPAPIMVDPPRGAPEPGGHPDPGDPDALQARKVEKHPDAQSLQPVAWDKVTFDRPSSSLTVSWWSGVEPCTVLGDVTVEFLEDEVLVTVLEGTPPDAATISCVAMAEYKMFTVTLDEDPDDRPFHDGAR